MSNLAYYKRISTLTADQLTQEWEEETAEQYEEMLEVLPPLRMDGTAFVISEMLIHSQVVGVHGLYDAHIEVDGRYFHRPAPLKSFDPLQYEREVNSKFYGSCTDCGHPRDVNGMCTNPSDSS